MPAKWKRVIIPLTFLLIFLVTVVVRYLQPSAEDVARAYLVEEGWESEKIFIVSSRWSTGFLNITESQTFDVFFKDAESRQQMKIRLSRPIYFLGWQVIGTEEKPPE